MTQNKRTQHLQSKEAEQDKIKNRTTRQKEDLSLGNSNKNLS